MRIRKKKWAQGELDLCPYYIQHPEQFCGGWHRFFANDNPLELEVGCGKCGFIAQKALLNPDANFLAVDIKSDMLGVGRRNIEKLFSEHSALPHNIALCAYNVEHIEKIVSPLDEIRRIYINFCNPWPRNKHKKRRLTYPVKLKKYAQLLSPCGEICFKTDDDELFSDSVQYFKGSDFDVTYITYDLHRKHPDGNIMTEHEKMFSEQGIKIKYLTATKR